MSDTDQGHATAEPGSSRQDPAASTDEDGADAQLRSTIAAGVTLFAALRHLLGALRKLAVAEGRMLRISIPLLLVGAGALVVFGVALWLCLVALIGWLLMAASGSLELALGLLVLIHVLLVGGIALMLLVSLRQASFPRTRTELRLLGRTLRYDFDRVTGATGDPLRAPESADKSNEKEGAT